MISVLIQRLTVLVRDSEGTQKALFYQDAVTGTFETREAVLEYASKKGWKPKKVGKSALIFHREIDQGTRENLHKALIRIGAPIDINAIQVDCTYIIQEMLLRKAGKDTNPEEIEKEKKPKKKAKK